MASRLPRPLFGARYLAPTAALLRSAVRPCRSIGSTALARMFTAAAAGTLQQAWFPPRGQSFAPAASPTHAVLILIQDPAVDPIPALRVAQALSGDIRAVHVDEDSDDTHRLTAAWTQTGAEVPLLVLQGDGLPVAASLRAYVDLLARERATGKLVVVLPECESLPPRAKIRCVFGSLMARLAFARTPGVRMLYGGSLAPACSGRDAGRAVEL